ncbi:MAG: DUF5685 family protein [Lachnospiraceae bacterium]
MFGYIIVNKQEMKFKEFDLYQSYYCGFCQKLRERYGKRGQLTLSYDMTFVIILLTSLYESKTEDGKCKCIAHPFEAHPTRSNEFTEYAADMNLLLSYYKCLDDWQDEHKVTKKVMADILLKNCNKITQCYCDKAELIRSRMEEIHKCEQVNSGNIDEISGYFGEIMSEIFAYAQDEWQKDLRQMGFFLGKFIYLMDAYEDIEKDKKTGNYNPFLKQFEEAGFEEHAQGVLTMMMAECSKAFERLPIVENTEILRNILYSGVWCRYELVRNKRQSDSQKTQSK